MKIHLSKAIRILSNLLIILFTFALNVEDATGAWVTETVDNIGNPGYHNSLVLDSSGHTHISYRGASGLMYTTNASGFWATETVDNAEHADSHISIAIDSTDHVHISYVDSGNRDLKYATNATGLWLTSTIDGVSDVDWGTSIAIDSSDKVHISYLNRPILGGDDELKYASNVPDFFVTTTVDSSGDLGVYNSIEIDSKDKVHISYYSDDELKYATNSLGFWSTSTVDDYGAFNAIAIDSTDKVHISYWDSNNEDLKYATNAPGFWITETLDSVGDVGQFASIAVDSLNKVHISYQDDDNKDLKYATNASGSWQYETVEDFGWITWYLSIAVDSSNKVHISYHDDTSRSLKYARSVIPYPAGRQTFFYDVLATPVKNINPAQARPLGIGSFALGGDRLGVGVSLEQFEGAVDIFGAYTVSTDPEHVYLLNPDGSTFTKFTLSDINNALITGTPPDGAEPWRSFIIAPLDELIISMPVSSLPSTRIYSIHLLVVKTGFVIVLGNQAQSLRDYYLWSTSFVVP